MFDTKHVVFKLFDKIPVSVRYLNDGYGSREFFAHILYTLYGGHLYEDEMIEDVQGLWFNNKNGSELIIYTKTTDKETNIDGMMVHCIVEPIDYCEENIIKSTAKELGLTQKELADEIGVAENTIGQWSRGIIDTPKWAMKMFYLLKIEKKYNTAKHLFCDLESK